MDTRKALRKVALFNDTRPDSHFGCSLVIQQAVSLLRSQNITVEWFWPVGRDWHGRIDWRRAAAELDGIVVNGEGTIHRTTERKRARWLTELAPFVRDNTSLPTFLINAGIHDIDPQCIDNLRSYSGIYVRDRLSQHSLRGYGIQSDVVPDLSLSTAFPGSRERVGICATDSVLPEVTDAIRQAARKRDWRYRPLHFAGKHSLFFDTAWWLRSKFDPETLPARFAAFTAKHQLVVTGRYHMVAYCLATETPFVAVESNTPKIGALLSDVFGDRRRLLGPDSIAALDTGNFDSFTSSECEAIDTFLAAGRSDTSVMITHIRNALDTSEDLHASRRVSAA